MGAILATIAELYEQLARAQRELAGILQNELDVRANPRLMSPVERTTTLLTVRDVAQRLALSERTVRRLRQRGQLPAGIEIAGVIRWRLEEIEAWIGGER